MQQRLNNLARDLVGDCNSPNVFFVTNTASGDVIAIFVTEEAEGPIRFADSHAEPLVVEDRITGVVYDNRASLALLGESTTTGLSLAYGWDDWMESDQVTSRT